MPAEPHQNPEQPHIGIDHQLPAPPEPEHKRSKTVRVLVWIILLLIFAVAFWLVWNHKATTSAAAPHRGPGSGPVTITTVTAQQGNLGVYLDSIGTVTPVYTSSITSQVNGVINAVHYREGQLVRKGDPLIDIDSRPYRATLLQAQGALERDQNLLVEAQMDLDRYKAAWARNAIPRQQLEDQEKLVLQDQGTVKNDQGLVQYDQVQVDYCHITAPITGRVGLRLVDPGNVVQSSSTTSLVVITQIQPITVVFTIPEDNLGQVESRVHAGAKLPVEAFDRAGIHQIEAGSLITLDNQVDTTTGTVKGRASFTNKGEVLFPNQFVNTRLLVNTLQNATLIPDSTIQHNGTTAFVYVIQEGVAHEVKIKPSVSDNGITAVQAGLKPGDVIADSSFDKLQDKSKVILSSKPIPAATSGSDAP